MIRKKKIRTLFFNIDKKKKEKERKRKKDVKVYKL